MELWQELGRCIGLFRPSCSRRATFGWLAIIIACMCARSDLAGVSSFVRSGWLVESCYPMLLHFFNASTAVSASTLTAVWVDLVPKLFTPLRLGGRAVCLADGIKIAKEGKKMPGVKYLHNGSDNNSKPDFIMGHSFQTLSFLADTPTGQAVAVPLTARLGEGVVFTNRDKRTLLDKLVLIFREVAPLLNVGAMILVADAYYASRKIILPLLALGHHLVSRVRSNAVAYYPAARPARPGRGRPRIYGKKVKLASLFKEKDAFESMPSPVYGETDVTLKYRRLDLLWRPVGRLIRFVLVIHPTRGKIIIIATDITMTAADIILAYGLRFKIEVAYKQAIYTLGTFCYRFWMKRMKPIKRWSGNQYVHKASACYRHAVRRKLEAYHRFVQVGCVAQGLLQHLAVNFKDTVWRSFRSWMRTMKTGLLPSELVVSLALRSSLIEFIGVGPREAELRKILADASDPSRLPGSQMAA
jgi:hypothetical protein